MYFSDIIVFNRHNYKYIYIIIIKHYPKTPTATAASLSARSWSISTRASGRIVAVFLGCRSFCTAEKKIRLLKK